MRPSPGPKSALRGCAVRANRRHRRRRNGREVKLWRNIMALERLDRGDTLTDIARTYGVAHTTSGVEGVVEA
jgi:hypothetical protein